MTSIIPLCLPSKVRRHFKFVRIINWVFKIILHLINKQIVYLMLYRELFGELKGVDSTFNYLIFLNCLSFIVTIQISLFITGQTDYESVWLRVS